jgi:iron(III) transport system ATP-binding protein
MVVARARFRVAFLPAGVLSAPRRADLVFAHSLHLAAYGKDRRPDQPRRVRSRRGGLRRGAFLQHPEAGAGGERWRDSAEHRHVMGRSENEAAGPVRNRHHRDAPPFDPQPCVRIRPGLRGPADCQVGAAVRIARGHHDRARRRIHQPGDAHGERCAGPDSQRSRERGPGMRGAAPARHSKDRRAAAAADAGLHRDLGRLALVPGNDHGDLPPASRQRGALLEDMGDVDGHPDRGGIGSRRHHGRHAAGPLFRDAESREPVRHEGAQPGLNGQSEDRSMLALKDLTKVFVTDTERVTALSNITLRVEEGKLYGLLGPSGCGKSTLLRSIAGLETPTSGEIDLGGHVVFSSRLGTNVPPYRRDIGMVFQSYAIWPHMDVFHNVAFPLMYGGRRFPKEEIRRRVDNALVMVRLHEKQDRMAPLLSGGQQQRVALARALVYEPKLLLLDEPLSNLDAQLRVEMRKEIRDLVRQSNITTLFVTHDQSEALSISDRIAVLQDGRLVQEGSPADLYSSPQSTFIAKFVGSANLVAGSLRRRGDGQWLVATALGELQGVPVKDMAEGTPVCIAIRPEAVHLEESRAVRANLLDGQVTAAVFTGDHTEFEFRAGNEAFELKLLGLHRLVPGETLRLYVDADRCPIVPR